MNLEKMHEKKCKLSDVGFYLDAEQLEKNVLHGLSVESGQELKWNGEYPSGHCIKMPLAEGIAAVRHFTNESASAEDAVHALTGFALLFCSKRVDPLVWALRTFEDCAEFYPMDCLQNGDKADD